MTKNAPFIVGLAAASAASLWPATVAAQVAIDLIKPQQTLDRNSVDLGSRVVRIHRRLISSGDPARPITIDMNITAPNLDGRSVTLTSDIYWDINYDGSQYIHSVQTPIGSSTFITGGWGNLANNFAQPSVGDGVFELYRNGGDLRIFDVEGDYYSPASDGNLQAGSVTYADGEVWNYVNGSTARFIVSSRGYGIQISGSSPSKYTYYNKAYVYCDESAGLVCSNVAALPSATITTTGTGISVAPPGSSGFQFTLVPDYTNGSTDLQSISKIGVPGSTTTYSYIHSPSSGDRGDGGGQGQLDAVTSANDGVSNFTYDGGAPNIDAYAHLGYVDEGVAYDPDGKFRIVDSFHFTGGVTSIRDQAGRYWSYGRYGQFLKLGSALFPEGNSVSYTYDARGNVTSETQNPKPNSSAPTLVRSANYPTSCTVTTMTWCNKPVWTQDARGNQTDYTYDPTTGKLTSETAPPDSAGVRAQKRYSYVQRYAWVLNGTGGYVHASAPIWLLASESTCRTSTATGNPAAPCAAGNSDEVKTVYDYGPDSGPNNLFLRGVAITAETPVNGTLTMVTLRTCYGNDRNGRRIWTTKPRANLASCS